MVQCWRIIFGILSVFLLFVVQSCNEDEGQVDPPVLSLISPNLVDGIYTTDESGEVELAISVNAPNGFNVLRISYEGINVDTQEFPRSEDGQTALELAYNLEQIVYGSSGTFKIIFIAVDDTNQTTEQVIAVQPGMPSVVLLEDNPDVEDGTLHASVGRTFSLKYRYTFPAGFGQFKITLTSGSNTSESVVTDLPPTQGYAVSDAITLAFDENFLGQDNSYTLEIIDILGNTDELVVPVSLIQPPAEIYKNLLLAIPAPDENSKTFFSTSLGQSYSVSDVSSSTEDISKEIDFGYYYGVDDKASLAGPANYPNSIYNLTANPSPSGLPPQSWITLNVTNFFKTNLTQSEFNEFDENSQSDINSVFEQALEANAGNPIPVIITDLQIGDVISFQTAKKNGNKFRGLLNVVNINGTDGSDDSIQIEVIVN